jgi:hypothetical protein
MQRQGGRTNFMLLGDGRVEAEKQRDEKRLLTSE